MPDARAACKAIVERIVNEEGQALLGWREVPINLTRIGKTAASVAPVFEQVFVGSVRLKADPQNILWDASAGPTTSNGSSMSSAS